MSQSALRGNALLITILHVRRGARRSRDLRLLKATGFPEGLKFSTLKKTRGAVGKRRRSPVDGCAMRME